MTSLATTNRFRIQSIDIVRGIVIIIMALDHVRDFFHKIVLEDSTVVATGPTDLETTTPLLFFTRWITHFCAPIFLFLAGTSAYLMSFKKTKSALSRFLITRGIFLILVEMIIITFGWTFNPFYNVIVLQVIWAIGISMVLLGLLIFLPYKILLVLGLIIVGGHNLLVLGDLPENLGGNPAGDLGYYSSFSFYKWAPRHFILIVYSFLPWLGVMILGYCLGELYRQGRDPAWRRKVLLILGAVSIGLFIILRLTNVYGDPVPWSQHHRGPVFSFLSFLNVNKYPPSLDFLAMTIGVGLIALALFENAKNLLTEFARLFGRVPMFFYILHIYLIHLIGVILFFVQGYSTDRIVTENNMFYFRPPEFGFGLPVVYLIWIFVVIILYPLCKRYDRYKSANVHRKKWLSYI